MKTNKWLVLIAVAIPSLMIEMAGTSVFVAFEVIATDLNVGVEKSVWLSTLYLAVNAMMIPLAGWLGSKFGYKMVIFYGVLIFTISSFLSSLALDFESLVVFRALQGLGDGPIMPIATALLLEVFPARERGRMMAIIMVAISIAPAIGPFFASWLVEEASWRAIFHMNVILGLVSLFAVKSLLPNIKPSGETIRVNWIAFSLLALGTGSLQLFLDRGQHFQWFDSNLILALFVVAVASLFIYLVVLIATKDKTVLHLGLLKDFAFLMGNFANILLMGTLYGALMLKVFYLQWILGFTVLQSGIYQAVLGGSMLIFTLISGFLTDKINPRWLVVVGLPICVYSLMLSTELNLHSSMETILIVGIIMGAGMAIVSTPLYVAIFATIKRSDMAAASVLNSYLIVMSGGVSLSVVTILLMHRIDVNSIHLANAVTPYNHAVLNAIAANPDLAIAAAYEQIARQGAMFAFADAWYLIALAMVLIAAYLPFMKRAKQEEADEF